MKDLTYTHEKHILVPGVGPDNMNVYVDIEYNNKVKVEVITKQNSVVLSLLIHDVRTITMTQYSNYCRVRKNKFF